MRLFHLSSCRQSLQMLGLRWRCLSRQESVLLTSLTSLNISARSDYARRTLDPGPEAGRIGPTAAFERDAVVFITNPPQAGSSSHLKLHHAVRPETTPSNESQSHVVREYEIQIDVAPPLARWSIAMSAGGFAAGHGQRPHPQMLAYAHNTRISWTPAALGSLSCRHTAI
ncbi:hypothetical protein BC567DRAFT_230004, partial [Phyllosticta citribraziliensis]